MLFTEREPFVHSGAQSDDSAWNKAGTSFGTKLWQRSHVVGWKSTSSNTRRRLRRVLERNRDFARTNHEVASRTRFPGVLHEILNAFFSALVVCQPRDLPFSNALALLRNEMTSLGLTYPFKLTN